MDRTERIRWFAREVLPHEPAVRIWLARRVRGLPGCDLDEVIQEAYARVWAADTNRISNPRAYFFVTARHLVGEAMRRARIVSIEMIADMDSLNIVDDGGSPERRLSGREDIERLMQALSQLPAKCRVAFELRKFDGLSQREIALRMNLSESTVEKHLAKALRLVMEQMKETLGTESNWSQLSHESRRQRKWD